MCDPRAEGNFHAARPLGVRWALLRCHAAPSMAHMKPKGASLRALRESKHITRRALARSVGVSHQFVSRLEADRATASVETMQGLADRMGVELAAIAHTEQVTA